MAQPQDEEYLGGLESGRMVKAGGIAGYGIYATTKRIIGVKSRRALLKQLAGAPLGGMLGAAFGARLSRDDSARVISELEQKKDLEVTKGDVSGIELKKPTFVHRGHVVISRHSGDPFKVILADKGDYERILKLMQAFRPDAVTSPDSE